jgi:hypothetical protein
MDRFKMLVRPLVVLPADPAKAGEELALLFVVKSVFIFSLVNEEDDDDDDKLL